MRFDWKRAAIHLAGCVLAAGIVWAFARAGHAQDRTRPRLGTVEATAIVLKDDDGVVRAELGVKGGTVALILYDGRHRETCQLMGRAEGGAVLSFPDGEKPAAASLGCTEDGDAILSLGTRNHVGMAGSRDGMAGLMISDAAKRPRYSVVLDARGRLEKQ